MQIFTMMKRKEPPQVSKNHKRGYNQVAYVRHGKDHVMMDGSGAAGGQEVKTVWVTAKNGQKWEIPVDPKTGKVPNEYLYSRFLSRAGSRTGRDREPRKDLGVDADILHEIPDGGFTPQQLIQTGWWQYPNESDIINIDDTGAYQFAKELEEASKGAQGAGKEMIFLMPPASAARARSILAKDFTGAELKKAVRTGGIIIKEGNPGRGNAGCYYPRQAGQSIKVPVIVLGKGWDEETLVHEFTHHLRHVDVTREGLTRTPVKMNEYGEWVNTWGRTTHEANSASNLEEAATVAESYVRIQDPPKMVNGYYFRTNAHGDTAKARSDYDRKTLVPVAPKKGRRAENLLKDKFADTSISHLGYYRPGQNAISYLKDRTAAGTLPKASKFPAVPKKKTLNVTAGATAGRTGATAMKKKSTSGAKKKVRK